MNDSSASKRLRLLVGGAARIHLAVEVKQQRVGRAGTPRTQEREMAKRSLAETERLGAAMRICWLHEQRVIGAASREPLDLILEHVDVAGLRLELSASGPVHLILADELTRRLQVIAHQALQAVGAERALQRPPMLRVDAVGSLSERHEQVVAQQVGLAQADTRRVDRLEDLVRTLSFADRHEHQREPIADRRGETLDLQLTSVAKIGDTLEKEAVGVADSRVPRSVDRIG